jgi:hypothetical protein
MEFTMEIIIKKIRKRNLYYGYVNPGFCMPNYGIFFSNNLKGFNSFLSFVMMIQREWGFENIDITFNVEPISTYDNDLFEQIDPPF